MNNEGRGTLGPATPRPVRLRTLVLIRWVAIAGQASSLVVVQFGLGFPLPLEAALSAVGASAILNLAVNIWRPAAARPGEGEAAAYLGFDVAQLAVLLHLTGGLQNPFAILLLAPVTVSATILSRRATVALCMFSFVCITVLAVWHRPLPWTESGLSLPLTLIFGIWVALNCGVLFVASYVSQVAREARGMSDALMATQLALAREQQLSAVGGLAAAAAHELGTPLATITVAVQEIARNLPGDSPIASDIALLRQETKRCRDILATLVQAPGSDSELPFSRLSMPVLVETACDAQRREGITVRLETRPATPGDAASPPLVGRSPEIIHGLENLVQNAVQFATSEVLITTRWSAGDVAVEILDDGEGFPLGLIDRLGEPHLSVRREEGEHMGLGVFIAETLLHHTGAKVTFAKRHEGGARVEVAWNRADIEIDGPAEWQGGLEQSGAKS